MVYIYFIGKLLDNDEQVPDDKTEITSHGSFAGIEAQDLEAEAVKFVKRAGHNKQSLYTTINDTPLPL